MLTCKECGAEVDALAQLHSLPDAAPTVIVDHQNGMPISFKLAADGSIEVTATFQLTLIGGRQHAVKVSAPLSAEQRSALRGFLVVTDAAQELSWSSADQP